MKLLLIGGTRFLGRHVAQQALERGHDLTLLHRGRSGPDLFPEARHLIADRDGDLGALATGRWDACIDTSAYFPQQVRRLAAALDTRVDHYQLVSSISVYTGLDRPGLDENAPLTAPWPEREGEKVTGENYGGLKVQCERVAADAAEGFGSRCLINRPGLIVGPHDPTGRFSWWLRRAERGGEMLAPGDPAGPVQFIDARDLAAWMLLQAERGTPAKATGGPVNLTGPAAPLTMGALLEAAARLLAPAHDPVRLSWLDEAFLLGQQVKPWSDLPLWLAMADVALCQVSTARAQASGLRCRPLGQTIADTAAWLATQAETPRTPPGLPPEREAQLLAAWKAR